MSENPDEHRPNQYQARASAAGAEGHDRLGLVLNTTGLALWEWDVDSGAVLWEGTRIGSLPPAGAGRTTYPALLEAVHPDDRSALASALERCAETGSQVEHEFRTVDALDPRWVQIRGERFGSAGERRVLGLAGEITQRKRDDAERMSLLRDERRARSEADATARRLSHLQLVTETGLANLSLDDLLERLLERVRDALAADTATVLLRNQERDRLKARASVGIDLATTTGTEIPTGEGIAGQVVASGQPVVIDDLSTVVVHSPYLRDSGVQSLAAVPLVLDRRTIGVLHVGSYHASHFTAEAVELLSLVADRVALAVDRAAAYERAQDIAEVLQRILLPERLPDVPGIDLAGRYQAGDSSVVVGGDWYDAIPTTDGRILVMIGDVMGRGVRAAAVMAQLRNAGRVAAARDHGPAQIISQLNRLVGALDEGRFATLVCLLIDPGSGSVSFSNAGHPPPLLRLRDGTTAFLREALGPPLGASDHDYDDYTLIAPMGSVFILYTDGLVEARNLPLTAGLRRLATSAAEQSGSASAMCDHLLQAALSTGPVDDDVAVLAVGLTASPVSPLDLDLPAQAGALSELRAALRPWLTSAGLNPQAVEDIVGAASEAATNVVEHGDPPGHGHLRVTAQRVGDTVTVTVGDGGRWQPPSTTDQGRGLLLMEALVDRLEVVHQEASTTVYLSKNVR